MRAVAFNSMSIDELWKVRKEVDHLLVRRITAKKVEFDKTLAKLGREEGPEDLKRPARRPYPKVSAKYKNPRKPAEKWSGRGRQPRWLTAELQAGKKLEDFLIAGARVNGSKTKRK